MHYCYGYSKFCRWVKTSLGANTSLEPVCSFSLVDGVMKRSVRYKMLGSSVMKSNDFSSKVGDGHAPRINSSKHR